MSEAEKKRRFEYRQKRKQWIVRLTSILAALLLLAVILSVVSVWLNKERYIGYTESSKIEYGVFVKENDFYEDSYLGQEYEYVASLIDKVAAEFIYNLSIGSENAAEYEYTYRVDAVLETKSKTTGRTIYSSTDEIISTKSMAGTGREVMVREYVIVDYVAYNERASAFISKFGLKETESNLILKLHVDIIGNSAEFNGGQNNTSYVASLDIPLTTKTVDVSITSDTPDGNGLLLAKDFGTVAVVFRVLTIVFWILTALLAIALLCFIYLTRNTDITYEIRVKRLLRNYKSYIQKLKNGFDMDGYQLLQLDTFAEMLEVRDIIQSPILMNENKDKTRTEFLIPTDTKLLYMFELKVDDYDELYSRDDEPEVEEAEPEAVDVPAEELAIETALAQPDIELAEIDYVEDDDDKFVPAPEEEGVEVVGVVWPERPHRNKVYRYDPDGEVLEENDVVLVPTRDTHQGREVIRKATVAHGNHRVAKEHITHPLKKIIRVVKRKAEDLLTSDADKK